MSDALVTVAKFRFPYEAQMWKLKLESEGIKCFVADETAYRTVFYMEGVRLQVAPENIERATGILGKQAI